MVNLPGRTRDDAFASSINVTPMVDVMLVLLIIFMVVTVTLPYTAQLPRAGRAAPAVEDRVTLGIDDQGRYWMGRSPVAATELPVRLQAAYAQRPGDHVLYLKADHGAPYGTVLGAAEAARRVGVRTMAFITERAD
ncbi:MAG TPA: biopolymer transporter ExbD [Longimicrobium sp.]|jgi:biopolymer transport protein ExbD/biopolymer transport protein TolR|nr:biopolymer transporter ExbD [Longimicrobium sp.]